MWLEAVLSDAGGTPASRGLIAPERPSAGFHLSVIRLARYGLDTVIAVLVRVRAAECFAARCGMDRRGTNPTCGIGTG